MFYDAWRQFRRGKHTRDILTFEYNLEQQLSDLESDVKNGTYHHGDYQVVEISDKKKRTLHVAAIRDRVVHRFLYDYLVRLYDPTFDEGVFSGRKGRGLDLALRKTQAHLAKHPGAFVIRADIKKAFDSIDHAILLDLLRRRVEPAIHALCREVIRSYSSTPNCGIPIGNLTSQIFSLIYLNELDRFVRHDLRPLAYLRYGDDFIIFFPSKLAAEEANAHLTNFLTRDLKMTLNRKNSVIVKSRQGLRFLGHIISATELQVDNHTTAKIFKNARFHNLSSYKQLHLSAEVKDALDRQIIDFLP